jgi:arsenate reductase
MAEAILRYLAGDDFESYSAGTNPNGLHPKTIAAMHQIGINITGQSSKDVSQFAGQQFDLVITVCDRARQQCPTFPGAEAIHWGFDDPAEAPPEHQDAVFRRVRDELFARLRLLVIVNRREVASKSLLSHSDAKIARS